MRTVFSTDSFGFLAPESGLRIALEKVRLKVIRIQCRPVILLALLAGLLVQPAGAVVENDAPARLVALTGAVSVVRAQAPVAAPKLNDPVQFGDELVTGQNSSATLRLLDGSMVRIYHNSRVVFRDESGSWKDFLHVFFGTVRIQIEKLTGRPNPKTVTTPTAIVAVRGTIFNVIVDRNQETKVEVEEGLVSVSNPDVPDEEVQVPAGQCCWVRRGQRPSRPQPIAAGRRGTWASRDHTGMGLPGKTGPLGTMMGGGMHGASIPGRSSGGPMHGSSGKMGRRP